jgi:hypothetical protein
MNKVLKSKKLILVVFGLVTIIFFSGCGRKEVKVENENNVSKQESVVSVVATSNPVINNKSTTSTSTVVVNKTTINTNTSTSTNGCGGWYDKDKYNGTNKLIKVDFNEKKIDKNKYQLFKNNNFSFYYPKDWKIDNVNSNEVSYYFGDTGSSLTISSPDNFMANYNICLSRCFDDAFAPDPSKPLELNSPTAAFSCSGEYSKTDLEKIISGKYIYSVHTGPLPGDGASDIYLNKTLNKKIIEIVYIYNDFESLPSYQKLSKGRSWDELTNKEKKTIQAEHDQFLNDNILVVNSFQLVN